MIPIEQCKFINAVVPAAVNNATATKVTIDTKGWSHLRVLLSVGVTDCVITAPKLQDSADDSTYADLSGAILSANVADTDDSKLYAIDVDLTGGNVERYIQVHLAVSNATAANVCATGILSRSNSGSVTGLAENGTAGQGLEELVSA